MIANNRILVIDDNIEIHEDFRKIIGNNINNDKLSAFESLTAEILGKDR